MELNEILELKVNRSDLNHEITIRQWFYDILSVLWTEGEGFNGKRPFGNSGWDYEVYKPLIKAGLIQGAFDKDGYIKDIDESEAIEFVLNKIIKPLIGV